MPVSKLKVQRIFKIAEILEDSALYKDLPGLYQWALSESKTCNYELGEVKAFFKLANEYSLIGDYAAASSYCDSVTANENVPDSLRKSTLLIKGTAASVLGAYSSAVAALDEALAIPLEIADELEIYDYLSYSYAGIGLYDKATEVCFIALDFLKDSQPQAFQHFSQFYHNLGLINLKNEEYRKAISYYREALSFNLKYEETGKPAATIDNVKGFARSKRVPLYLEMGQAYRHLGIADSAISALLKAKVLADSSGNRNRELRESAIAINLANVYNDVGKFDTALVQLAAVDKHFSKGKLVNHLEHVNYLITKGFTFTGLGQKREALNILLLAEQKADSLGVEDHETIANLYTGISSAYESLGAYKQSLEYFRALEMQKDTIYNAEKARVIKELEGKYLAAEKQKQLAEYEMEQNKLNNRLAISTAAFLFLFVISLVLFRFYRLKRRDNQLLSQRNYEIEKKNIEIDTLSKEREQTLLNELKHRERELSMLAVHSHEKNEFLLGLKRDLEGYEKSEGLNFRSMKRNIEGQLESDANWKRFVNHFENVHPNFFNKLQLQSKNLTDNDLKLSAYIRIGLANKELAATLGIDYNSARNAIYRLKKKLNLTQEQDLREFIRKI